MILLEAWLDGHTDLVGEFNHARAIHNQLIGLVLVMGACGFFDFRLSNWRVVSS